MSKYERSILLALLILGLAVIACNMPAAVKQPAVSSNEIANAATVPAAQAAEVASPTATATVTPSPTPCNPGVTANVVANIRSGPSTDYNAIGNLPAGGTAPVAGRNDAGTWWYIQFPGGFGGYAWVAGSVVTSSCIPPVLPVVAAPPLPVVVPATATEVASGPLIGPVQLQKQFQFELVPSPTSVWQLQHFGPLQINP
jgi:uncharacterized protein YraI